MSVQADGTILIDDRVLIPSTCRQAMLEHFHIGHFGRDKMKSLARLLCWWPSMDAVNINFGKSCDKCRCKPRTHPNWKPWPTPFTPMQRVHVDSCGPFLGKIYALVVEDAYSKFPEVFLTQNATADFTKQALRKFFSREGVAQVLVTDNGTHFTDKALQTWLKSIGYHTVFTAPRHPCSNGQAENFVRTLKTAIRASSPSTIEDLHNVFVAKNPAEQTEEKATQSPNDRLLFT